MVSSLYLNNLGSAASDIPCDQEDSSMVILFDGNEPMIDIMSKNYLAESNGHCLGFNG